MEALDTTILNTAVPTVAKALGVAPLNMKSVLSSYTLSLAIFIPVSGWMADRFGTRKVFGSSIMVFTLGSLLCGLSTDVNMLTASRILQGFGGAMMVPVGRLTMVRTFSHFQLIRAMSFVAIPALVGPMLGPVVGGLIVNYFHWRMIFLINLPVGIAGLVLVYLHLPDYRDEAAHPLDFVGLLLFGSGIGLLSYVLEVFGEHRLETGDVLGLLAVSITLLSCYIIHAVRSHHPLLQLNLLRTRTFAAAVSGGFFTLLGPGGAPFLLPLLYQEGIGLSPLQSGLLIMPQALAALSTKLFIVRLLRRVGYRAILVSSTVALGILLMSFGLIGAMTPAWLIVVQALAYGAMTSIQHTTMNSLTYMDVPAKRASNASSIANSTQQLSVSFGIAVAALATVLFVPHRASSGAGELVQGLHHAFFALGLFTAFSTLVFRRLKATDGFEGARQDGT